MPISLRLDDQVRQTLESEARARHVGLSAFLREIITEEARRIKRERIREQSRAVAEYVASNPQAAEFYEDWGSSNPINGG
jgi:post-segregation antitoxin (ccd killing protein)